MTLGVQDGEALFQAVPAFTFKMAEQKRRKEEQDEIVSLERCRA